MPFEIKPATRVGIKPFLVFFGLSSGGKTHSALLFARGMVGPQGRIGVVDTENGRASILADVIPGGFQVIDFQPPFTPDRYIEALNTFIGKADVLVIDSASHCWFQVQDMHEEAIDRMTKGSTDWKERERLNWPAWRGPKMEFKQFTQAILRFPTPVIFCMRAKVETKMVKGSDGKNTIVTGEHPIPDFDQKFIFEATLGIECYQADGKAGLARPFKWSRNELLECLPRAGQQIGIEHGAALTAWCAAPGGNGKPATQQAAPTGPALKELKVRLMTVLAPILKATLREERKAEAQAWLRRHNILTPEETLESLATVEQLQTAVEKSEIAIADVQP
jgi:hypothetical protein